MKKIIIFLIIVFAFVKTVFALPIGVFVLGYDFFILFFWIVSSLFITLLFYFKNLNIRIKIWMILFLFLLFFILKYFYIEYNKKKFLKEYSYNIQNIKVDKFYMLANQYDNFDVENKKNDLNYFAKSIWIEDIDKNLNKYLIINILENWMLDSFDIKDKYKNIKIKQIRPIELFNNFERIKKENWNKKIIVTCITWYRSSIISWFLNKKWYNTFFIKWWMKTMWIVTFRKKRSFVYCKDQNYDKKNIINIWYNTKDKYNAIVSIPYLDMTDDDFRVNIKKMLKTNIFSKKDSIVLSCDMNFMDNCSLWRQWANWILKNMWFNDVCFSMGIAF